MLSLTVASIQKRVRNVWHNHCISSLRGKKHKEETEKADVLLWQPHFSGSWKEDSKSLSSYQSLICLHLKQRKESTKTCVEGKANIRHHDEIGMVGQTFDIFTVCWVFLLVHTFYFKCVFYLWCISAVSLRLPFTLDESLYCLCTAHSLLCKHSNIEPADILVCFMLNIFLYF